MVKRGVASLNPACWQESFEYHSKTWNRSVFTWSATGGGTLNCRDKRVIDPRTGQQHMPEQFREALNISAKTANTG